MTVENIAGVCHEANRAYCETIGDHTHMAWEAAPGWQIDSAINGVQFHLDNPSAGPSDAHENWLKEKRATGWVCGGEKDAEKKTHPCIVAYDQLPKAQQAKDVIFASIVHALKPQIKGPP